MTRKRQYHLNHLVGQCDANAPVPQDVRDWEDAPMIGLEQRVMDSQVDIRESVLLFAEKIRHDCDIERLILFGSRARGDQKADSDVDVAVILRGEPGDYVGTRLKLARLAYDVLLETGARIQAHPVWVSEWAAPDSYSNPLLLENIERDGITLWSCTNDPAD